MHAMPHALALAITPVVAAAVALVGAAPALADPSDAEVSAAYGVMLTKKEAKALGVRGDAVRSFNVTSAMRGQADAPWLCDLTGLAEVEGKGGNTLYASEVLSLGTAAVSEASQEVHSYANAAAAKRAYDDLVKKAKQCAGQQQPAADDEADGTAGMTTQLTNGTRSSDRGSFLWVRSQTTMANAEGFVSHQYLTARLIGPYVQVIEIESEGTNAPDLTAKAIKAADRLTMTLGDLWRTS